MDSWGAQVVDGRLTLDDPDAFKAWVATMDGQRVTVTVTKGQRSHAQNRYYQGVVVPVLAEQTGYEQPEMHEVLKAEFLPYGHASTATLSLRSMLSGFAGGPQKNLIASSRRHAHDGRCPCPHKPGGGV